MSDDTERVSVRTYIPRYQRQEWDQEADDLEMSRSEFMRTMVQAGRRDFNLEDANPSDQNPDLESQVLDLLQIESPAGFDELFAALTSDIEDQLDETLESLQSTNRIKYSGRKDGYTLMEGDDE